MTAQQAFEFANKLNYFYNQKNGVALINTTLLEYLGKEKYVKFCKEFEKMEPRKEVPKDSFAHFKESFEINTPYHTSILFDKNVRYFWGLATITNTVFKVL